MGLKTSNKAEKLIHFIPLFLTAAIMLLVYIIKGVYPFGTSDIAYYDMIPHYVPNYARLYEVLHGNDSLMYSWLIGCGMDMSGTSLSAVHPINWIVFFIRPDHMLRFMAVFLVIKLMIASFSMSLYLKKAYNTGLLMHIALCMLYTFSGFTAIQYVNIGFLDSMMVFPLIILSLRYMYSKGNGIPYLILLTLQLISSWYLSFMALLFLLFYSFGMICITKDKKKKHFFAARVGIYTFGSVIISAAVNLPSIMKNLSSIRFTEHNRSFFDIFFEQIKMDQFLSQKVFVAYNTEFAVALFVLLIFFRMIKKERFTKETAFSMYMFILVLMPIFNESTHLLWHGGSYSHFPYRFGYMFSFAAIDLILCVWKTQNDGIYHNKIKNRFIIPFIAAFLFLGSMSLYILKMAPLFMEKAIYGWQDLSFYNSFIFIFLTGLISYILLLLFSEKKTTEYIFSIVSIFNAALVAVTFIAPLNNEQKEEYIVTDTPYTEAIDIRNKAGLDNDSLSRIKLLSPALSMNYSLLLGTPSMTQWNTDVTAEYLCEITALGYSHEYILNYDWGGTVFTDALLNNKTAAVYGDSFVPEELYKKQNTINEYSIYDMVYKLPFGLLTDKAILSTDSEKADAEYKFGMVNDYVKVNTLTFDHQIQIADALIGKDRHLISKISSDDIEFIQPFSSDYKYTFKYDVHIDRPSVVYASLEKYTHVTVNGKLIETLSFENNNFLIEDVEQGIRLIGVYDTGTDVEICVSNQTGNTDNDFFAIVDLEAMQKLCDKYENSCASSYKAGKNQLNITADVESGKNYMFLPLEYLEGWKAETNGAPVNIHPVMNGAFMALELPEGHCDIVMKYLNPNIVKGSYISIFGILLIAGVLIMKKLGKDVAEIPFVADAAYILLSATAVCGLFVINILPILI